MNKLVTKLSRAAGFIEKDEILDPEVGSRIFVKYPFGKWCFFSQLYKCKAIFVATQFVYTLLTLVPSLFVFHDYYYSCGWLIFNFLVGTWNGASYYIEVFSKRYNLKFEQAAKEAEAGEEAAAPAPGKGADAAAAEEPCKKVSTGSSVDVDKLQPDEEPLDYEYEFAVDDLGEGGDGDESVGSSASVGSDLANLDESQALELIQMLDKLERQKSSSLPEGAKFETAALSRTVLHFFPLLPQKRRPRRI